VSGEFSETHESSPEREHIREEMQSVSETHESSPKPERARKRIQPVWMNDFVSGDGLSEEEIEENFALYISQDDPTNYDEAVKEKKWQEAMKLKIQAIEKNRMWELVSLPDQAKKIGVKWVYKTKLNEEGMVDKFKAGFVAKGY
jgi:anaerobic ribonucleoside-triphosphate reductase